MLQSVLKSKFGYDDFKSDIQKQATVAVHKGFYKRLMLFKLSIYFFNQCIFNNAAHIIFFKNMYLVLYYQQIVIRLVKKNLQNKLNNF